MKGNSGVDINYINPFLIGAGNVFNSLLKVDLKKGKTVLADEPKPAHDVVIRVDMKGKANGYVLYSLGFKTVNKIAEALMPGITKDQIKSEYRDILGELANMITGNAVSVLPSGALEISTPTVMHKSDIRDSGYGKRTVLVLKQYSPYGQLETTVVLKPAA